MPKSVKQERPAERPERETLSPAQQTRVKKELHLAEKVITMRELLKARAEARKGSLTLTVRIPAQFVPLFKAMVELTEAASPECLAVWAICKGITSEEAMKQFDDLVNELL